MLRSPTRRIAAIAALVAALDQLAKQAVLHTLPYNQEKIIIPGFFKFVHWGNTGAAWSLFAGNNLLLELIAIAALVTLFFSRHHFDNRTALGQLAFGLICGGIAGNLIDRIWAHHVIDFIRFYIPTRSGEEVGFPAFNIADSAICTGVALVFLMTLLSERSAERPKVQASAPGEVTNTNK